MIFQNIFEPVRKVDAPEELRPETELPPLEMPEPNFFDGMGDTWKAIPNAVLDTASSAITGLRQIPLENFTTQPEVREWVRRQREEVMPENARRIREIAKQEYELDPQTSGTAAQIVYGLGEMIPKAVLYGSVAGPAGGALLFGADVGVNRTQTLLDEGVDEQTAINAGMLTFAANAIGLKLPAAFATGSRLTSAAIGAGANVGLNVAEVQGVHWILENQNYDELAKNYELNFADNAVAAGLGAAFGAAFWRPTTRVRFEQERKALSERFATELERTGKFTPQQVTAQANLNASVVTSAASRWGLTPEQVSSVAPRVRVDSATTADGFDMPVTQGVEWHMGPSKAIKPDDSLTIIRIDQPPLSREEAISFAESTLGKGVTNKNTGFVLTATRSDMKKAAGRRGYFKERVFTSVARDIAKIVEEAVLVESHVDNVHKNPKVQGIHHFLAPVQFDGKLWRVQLLVKDFVEPGNDRAVIHTIDGIYIDEMETPPGGINQSEGGGSYVSGIAAADNRLVRLDTESRPTDRTLSLTDLIGGRVPYVRADGRGLFDAVEESSFAENGVYYEVPVLNQTAWHGSQNQFDRFSTEHIGEGTGRATHGWGLYFTSDKKVAEGYRDMTGPDGKVYKAEVPDNNVLLDANESYAEQPSEVREALARLYKDEYDTEPPPDHWTGREIYQDIILREEGYSDPESIPDDYMLDMEFDDLAGNSRLASEKLNSIGVKGVKFLGDDDDTGFVVFDDQAIKILDFYQRQGGESLGSYSPTENRITLTPNANVSTFSHEIGHWYLHNLMLASQFEEAAGNVKQDVDVLLKAFGINSVDDWNALGVNGQRKYHERFASWVEQYLSEGKSPSPSLVSFFKRFGEWLKDVYEHFSDAVGGRYQADFGEELPPLSAEVRKVLDRMYTDEFGSKTVRPDKTQVAAARAVQAEETNREKRNRILATDSEDDYSKAVAAQRKAASDLNSGTPVDVSQQMRGASLNEQVLGAEQKKFAREVMAGDGRTAVVLQNRDRSNVVSVGQMNSIASDPQYGLLSFSRNTASGAPIVSYGTLPDDAYLGVRDYVIDSGEQVPVQYAVVEADTVQTSNRFDGSQNPDYGDASLMNVVAGNGRLTGLTEAYRRGTAQQYRDALMADNQHGVDPAVIASMQHPVLVRYMPQEKVSSGFVSRSNSDQVMARSNVEIAAEDAPRIRENASLYRFDEEGMPTADTVRQFLIDIGEPNALGRLINSNGNPTPEAIRRIQTAVFHEAYQNDVLTELFSSTTDANIKRILTAMAAFAPRIIEMRTAGIDLARGIVEAANAVRMAREEGRSLQDLVSQLSFLDDPTTTPFIELLARNANSAAAIGRILDPLADWTVNAMRAADGGLFGDENVVRTDVG